MMTSVCGADWQATKILQMDGQSVAAEFPAQWQIVTETWNRVVAVPYIAYLPEKDRICMLVSCDYPHQPMVLFSDDRGATWGEPRPVSSDATVNASAGLGTALTYLGGGRLMLIADLEGIARAQVAPKGLKAFGAFDRGPVGAVERVGSKQNGQAVATAGRG